MKESVTYQAILREGRGEGIAQGLAEGKAEGKAEGSLQEAKALLLRLGQKKLGEPDASSQASIEAMGNVQQIELLAESLFDVATWQELLNNTLPRKPRKKGKR